jgi:hypothetical protein
MAVDFVRNSCFSSWIKEVCVAKITMDETADHPRILAMLIGESLELEMRDAKFREDKKQVCGLCKLGLSLKILLFEQDISNVICGDDCEYYGEFSLRDPD